MGMPKRIRDKYYEAYRLLVLESEERRVRMLKQIRFQLLENKQLKAELDEANRTIEIYINKNPLRLKESVDKCLSEVET